MVDLRRIKQINNMMTDEVSPYRLAKWHLYNLFRANEVVIMFTDIPVDLLAKDPAVLHQHD